MKGFVLTIDELAELKEAHRKAKRSNAHAAYKINAVILLGTGWKLKQVKQALLLDDETLRSYLERYREGRVKALIHTDYSGRPSGLSDPQEDQLRQELENTIHLSTLSIIDYVAKEFDKKYSQSGMRDLLHRLGYEYKKPKLVPGNPDVEAQEIFAEQYESFMETKPVNTEVLFIDAVHPEHNAQAAYGWFKRGQKRELKTNSGRQRLNLHGAINAETNEVTVIESSTVNTDSTIRLIETLDQKYCFAKDIILIADNAKYHYSKMVQEALKDHPRVRFVFLPSYSPNLNLIERLWGFFKKHVLHNKYHKDIGSFRRSCIKFFRNIDQHDEKIASLMSGGFDISYS
jgi:transposase